MWDLAYTAYGIEPTEIGGLGAPIEPDVASTEQTPSKPGVDPMNSWVTNDDDIDDWAQQNARDIWLSILGATVSPSWDVNGDDSVTVAEVKIVARRPDSGSAPDQSLSQYQQWLANYVAGLGLNWAGVNWEQFLSMDNTGYMGDFDPTVQNDGHPLSDLIEDMVEPRIVELRNSLMASTATSITLTDGTVVPASEYKAMMANASVMITTGRQYTNGMGEAVRMSDGSLVFFVDGSQLMKQVTDRPATGLAMFFFHELGHMTTYGQSFQQSLFNQHLAANNGSAAGWDWSSNLFRTNEQMADHIAIRIAAEIGIDLTTFVRPQYPPIP